MKIENLKEGMEVKYGELCTLLEIKPTKGGNSRTKQFNDLAIYCNYEKKGHKIIIKEIYEIPTITVDKILKNSKYIKALSNIIVEYLYNTPDDLTGISLSKLFTLLGITNNNYNAANYYRKELSQLYDIRLASIYYFYSSTRNEFKKIIERCLDNLRSRRVLNWYKVIMVRDDNTGQLYKADKETEKFIINSEKEALNYLNCSNMFEVMKDRKLLKKFTDIVHKETNINYFYAYDLVIGDIALKIEYDNVQEEKEKINKLIMDKTKIMFDKDKYLFFINDYDQLTELLINAMCKEDIKGMLIEKRQENKEKYINETIETEMEYSKRREEIKNKYMDEYE